MKPRSHIKRILTHLLGCWAGPLLSSDGMPIEDIADLVGHKGTNTTETVYRKVIVPELRRGTEVMDRLFS